VNFAFTQDQTDLRGAVRQVLEAECTPADVRRALGPPDRPDGEPSRERWSVLAQLGAPGLLAPPPSGLGLSDVELVVVLEEAGRAALPEPLAETAGLLVPLLVAAGGSDPRVAQHLERLAAGELLGAVGGLEITEDGWSVSTVDGPDGSARTPRVAAGMSADATALAFSGASGPELHLLAAADVDRDPVATLDPTRRLAEVSWRPAPQSLLAAGDRALELLGLLADRGALTSAAQLLGVAERLLELSAAYARDRRQFGRPIGSFEAVKHHLANVAVRLEFSRPAVYRAAWSMAASPTTRSHDVSIAKALASDAADLAARTAVQVHGAIGYTWECDVQLWAKRAWALGASWGDASVHRALVLREAVARATAANPAG
jgi:alkylation response protein AidB-like acyl-CoA dehydrogenase